MSKDLDAAGKVGLGVIALGALKGLSDQLGGIDATNVFSVMESSAASSTHQLFDSMVGTIATGLSVSFGAALSAGVIYSGVKVSQAINRSNVEVIRIAPSKDYNVKPENVEKLVKGFFYINRRWLERIVKGRMWFQYLIMKDEKGKIAFRLIVPKEATKSAIGLLKEYFPYASVGVDKEFKPFHQKGSGIAGHLVFASKKKGYGLNDKLENNAGSIINIMPPGSVIDIRFSPTSLKELREETGSGIGRILAKEKKTQEDNLDMKQLINRFRGHTAFDVAIHLWSKSSISDMARQIRQHTQGTNNGLKLKKYWLLPDLRNGLNYDVVLPGRTMTWNDTELAQLFFTPPIDHQVMEHIETILEKLKPKANELNRGLRIGYADHDDLLPPKDEKGQRSIESIIEHGRPICLQWDTLDRHGIIPGMTGSGKGGAIGSITDGFIEGWVEGLVKAGFTMCDPHESAALLVINRLLEQERQGKKVDWSRVRCYSFNPQNPYPTPMNLLHFGDGHKESISKKAAEVTQIILSAFPGELSKSAVLLQMALEALLSDGEEGHTIAQVTRLFRDTNFLSEVMAKVDNQFVRDELNEILDEIVEKQEKGKKATSIQAIVTRLFPFVGHTDMQRSFCQTQNVIDGKRIFQNGEIVLMDFKNAPDEAFKLTAAWLANHYYHVAKSREQYTGKHHYLIFDEAQLFRIGRFADIIRETRKFRFGLWLATQDMNALDDQVKKALKVNCGFQISLRQKDGVNLAVELMNNTFTESQIKELPDNHAALYSVEGSANILFPPPAFIWEGQRTAKGSAEAKKAYAAAKDKFNELVQRDCRHFSEVDKEIKEKMKGGSSVKPLAVVAGGLSPAD